MILEEEPPTLLPTPSSNNRVTDEIVEEVIELGSGCDCPSLACARTQRCRSAPFSYAGVRARDRVIGVRVLACKTRSVSHVATELMLLAGGDPFERVREASRAHQREHGCGLHTAGPGVMQLAASFVRTNNATSVLDLGCGLGYSTLWLADVAGTSGRVIGIDADEEHISEARRLAEDIGLGERIQFVVGEVADVLRGLSGEFDAVHDDAWFASTPRHLDVMISRLRSGGVLTMPNWFLLVDAIAGQPRNRWERFAGPTWAADSRAYAEQLAHRDDLSVNWITDPPLGVGVKA